MKKLIDYGFVAANIYFSGVCNLKCTYCFQPKIGSHMAEVNKKIINWISSGKMEEDIEKYIGKDVSIFSFWGGEPSINLPYILDRVEPILNKFPKLNEFSYSTNLSTPELTKNTFEFIKKCHQISKKLNRNIECSVQISMDGLPIINDLNRIGCSGSQIVKNITWLLQNLVNEGISGKEVSFSFKGTYGVPAIDYLSKENHLYEHYKYFDNLYSEWDKICDWYPTGGEYLTFVCPGQYGQEDGKKLAKITKTLLSSDFKNKDWKHDLRFRHQITDRIFEVINSTLRANGRPFKGEYLMGSTCSAGRSCAGITYDGMFHWCQATFFFDKETRKYIEDHNLVTDFEANQGFSFRNFDNFVDKIEAVSYNNDLDLFRSLEIPAMFRSNPEMRLSYLNMMVDELADSGLISECFKKNQWKDLLINYLIFGGNDCIADNVWEFGSVWIRNISLVILAANGVFEAAMEEGKKRYECLER